ncbi:MAG TPA: sugar phosphate isomerase/epimerase family protein [Armatimonadota bacterium]|nr:sugar phosphate isomerase/epimerase family protein [Armatimonadota bacterium]
MKLGVAGLLGDGSAEAARNVREMGFSAASWHLRDLDLAEDQEALLRVRDVMEEEELELCQLLPPLYPSLVHPDAGIREAGVEALARVVRAAVVLGAGSVYVRPGSLNDAGPWTPHPLNHAPETRARLVESLRALVPHAEEAGIPLAIEGHVVSPLHTPAVVREVLDAVGSPMLRFNADPVNFIGTLDQAYDSGALLDELFDLLGDVIVMAHAKDVTVGERLVVHIEECLPGQGFLDQETFLRRFEACCPRGVVLIEHLPPERVPEARRALLEFAARAGLSFQ